MSKPLIWSAINISEGRQVEALTELADSLAKTGAQLADWSADADHNRSVFSLIGDPVSLGSGLRLIFEWALRHVDIRQHQGHHPRLGAVDVVPFAPLGQTTMDQAREVGWSCASDIAERFRVPIFLYRESSSSQDLPLTLPYLRKGGLEQLAQRLSAGEVKSDFGPDLPHPTLGVSVFGARPPLVAYNCVLDTTDLEIGRTIASQVREKGGGPRGLQALAFPLEHRGGAVQISMNLLEPGVTPPHLAYLKVVEVAQRYGATVTSSELIGLVPQEALRAAFRHFLKLEDLRPNQVAEENLMVGRDV
jgi:glutamate formiminotransferase